MILLVSEKDEKREKRLVSKQNQRHSLWFRVMSIVIGSESYPMCVFDPMLLFVLLLYLSNYTKLRFGVAIGTNKFQENRPPFFSIHFTILFYFLAKRSS